MYINPLADPCAIFNLAPHDNVGNESDGPPANEKQQIQRKGLNFDMT
jgi:hypothetical protein